MKVGYVLIIAVNGIASYDLFLWGKRRIKIRRFCESAPDVWHLAGLF